ncbi:unnamed protein product, partial [Allacma fusca]
QQITNSQIYFPVLAGLQERASRASRRRKFSLGGLKKNVL